jgi:carboxypeptidase C (cathepsin A)
MRQNSALRVFNAAGYYDFATPFFDAEMSFMRNGVVPERITYAYYESGHMMYIHEPSLVQLMDDVRTFIEAGP